MFSGSTREALIVAMYGIKLFGIRFVMVMMTIPQFVLAVAVAFTDGLMARHARRMQGGHESATRYHHAKHLLMFGVIPLGAIIWLVAPVPLPIYPFLAGLVDDGDRGMEHGQVLKKYT
nr:DUF4400 domain-containing protein [Trinickia symbiotica]